MEIISEDARIPREKLMDYSQGGIKTRLKWLSRLRKVNFRHLTRFSISPETTRGNIENLIGCIQVPLGLAGPLKIDGEYAKGTFYVPLATSEGALVHACSAGMKLLTQCGGVKAKVLRDFIHVSPAFLIKGIEEAEELKEYVNTHFPEIKAAAESTTHYGKLLSIDFTMVGEAAILTFYYFTADAAGQNMICKATDKACKFIAENTKFKDFFIRSNFSSDKKVSSFNYIRGYGKEVLAEAVIPKEIFLEKNLKTTPEDVYKLHRIAKTASFFADMKGMNAQVANIVTAIFIACGQDPASVVNSSLGVTSGYLLPNGDIYMSLAIFNLVVGTVGGGTGLGTQRECLEMLDCYGPGKAKKFAEIIAASALAGEIAITISIANGTFIEGHERLGRNPPNLK